MKKKDLTPLVMWFILFSGILVLAFIRPGRIPDIWAASVINLDEVFIGLYLLWMIIELRVSKKDAKTEGKKTADAATCQLYGSGQALTILTALWFTPAWKAPGAAHFMGLGLFCFGVWFRLWAVRSLGQFYSHRVRTVEKHAIITSGPYRVIRHPAYAGMLFAHAGVCLYFLNAVTVGVFALALFPAIILRIFIEEKALFTIEGYAAFAEKRKRLIPYIW